jgi:putative oxidoreductase
MNMVSIVLQIVLGLGFLVFGASKLGSKQMVDEFKRYGLPQWFRMVTGLLEIGGAALIIAGIWNHMLAAIAGILLAIIMAGAIVTHLRIKDPVAKTGMPIILMVLSLIVLIMNWNALFG